jgi:hypothetical protein
MDHVVYLDKKADELSSLLSGDKKMIIRGATGRKLPYGRVNPGDILYLIVNDGSGLIRARGEVSSVINSKKMTSEQSTALVEEHQELLQLSEAQFKRWAGKRYLVLISVVKVESLAPFLIDKSGYGNMDDWLPVESIDKVKRA